MALVVEDGTGKVNAETYVDETEADTYHAKYGITSWASLTSQVKEVLLLKAMRYLLKYETRWAGVKRTQQQALAWPRSGVVDASGYPIPDNSIPQAVRNAQCELALIASTEDLVPNVDAPGAVASETVKLGPIMETKKYLGGKREAKRYTIVEEMLSPLLAAIGRIHRR